MRLDLVVGPNGAGYDNTRRSGLKEVALFSLGMPVGAPAWPAWTAPILVERWP